MVTNWAGWIYPFSLYGAAGVHSGFQTQLTARRRSSPAWFSMRWILSCSWLLFFDQALQQSVQRLQRRKHFARALVLFRGIGFDPRRKTAQLFQAADKFREYLFLIVHAAVERADVLKETR